MMEPKYKTKMAMDDDDHDDDDTSFTDFYSMCDFGSFVCLFLFHQNLLLPCVCFLLSSSVFSFLLSSCVYLVVKSFCFV